MAALFPRELAAAVLRPLAERLAGVAAPRAGELVVDAPCDGGVLAGALAGQARGAARVIALDADEEAVAECAAAARGGREGVRAVRAAPSLAPLRRGSCDMVASLLTLPHAGDPAVTMTALSGLLRPGGRFVAGVWGGREAVPHLEALATTLTAALGAPPAMLEDALALGAPGALEALAARSGLGGPRVERLRDVVRFNGVDHLWAAHCASGPLAAAVTSLGPAALAEIRDGLATRLFRVTAWDGTLVVPVELAVLVAGPG